MGASPKTIEIAQKLSRGEIVFIYVAPVDQARAAEKKKILDSALLQFIEVEKQVQLESGELPPETELKDVKAAKVSYVEISSVDPKEKFLYRTLIGLNPNTKDDGKEKLFGTVGRGFTFDTALTDKTFDEEQIVSFGLFLSGPCSCTVKSGNPGSDIISNWDWDSNIKNPLLKNDEPAEIDGFGGKEIESVDDASRSTKNNKSSANISPTGEQVADGNDLIKIILFGFSGLGVLLLIVTKFMKSNETK